MKKPSEKIGELRVHVGGLERRDGWKIMDVNPRPGVDFVGDIRDFSAFADNSVAEIYASHVMEHLPHREVLHALTGIHRVLKPSGKLYIAVPNLAALCSLFLAPNHGMEEKVKIIPAIFGAQIDSHDYHFSGFDFDLMAMHLSVAGFSSLEQVESLGLFDDTSEARLFGYRISLNLIAVK